MQLMVAGFVMVFFIQVAGNAMQIFASEVFPTNARASGFGWAAGVGRSGDGLHHAVDPAGAADYGLTTVFVCLATLLVIAAASVTQLGPEVEAERSRRSRAADRRTIEADNAFWLHLGRRGLHPALVCLVPLLLPGRQADLVDAGVPALYE